MKPCRLSSRTLLLALCVALCGCGGRSNRPELAAVSGQLTYRGKPVAGATVSFMGHGSPRPAIGVTDAEGRFQLTTFEPNDGAVLGTHVVTVYKPANQIEPMGIDPNLDPQAYARAMDEAAARAMKAQAAGSDLPAKYANASTSDVRKEVVQGHNVINIELSD